MTVNYSFRWFMAFIKQVHTSLTGRMCVLNKSTSEIWQMTAHKRAGLFYKLSITRLHYAWGDVYCQLICACVCHQLSSSHFVLLRSSAARKMFVMSSLSNTTSRLHFVFPLRVCLDLFSRPETCQVFLYNGFELWTCWSSKTKHSLLYKLSVFTWWEIKLSSSNTTCWAWLLFSFTLWTHGHSV